MGVGFGGGLKGMVKERGEERRGNREGWEGLG